MANRWERGKLGPYNMPQDFTEGGVALAGINNIKNKPEPFLVPVGTLFYSNLTTLTSGSNDFIRPSGQEISRATYPNLFNLIGTVFGSGDGSTTFNLPNLFRTYSRAQGIAGASGVFQFQPSQFFTHTHTAAVLPGSVTGRTFNGYETVPYDGTIAPNATRTAIGPFTQRINISAHNAVSTYGDDTRNTGVLLSRGVAYPTYFSENVTDLPIGAVIPFLGSDNLSPFGPNWLLCNGQAVPAALYPNAAVRGLTATPDLRGYFLASTNATAVSYASPAGVPGHRHLQSNGNACITPPIPSGNYWISLNPNWLIGDLSVFADVSTTTGSLGPGNETRPMNVAVNYFIRVN